jgi:hypothetical protein
LCDPGLSHQAAFAVREQTASVRDRFRSLDGGIGAETPRQVMIFLLAANLGGIGKALSA